MISFDYCLLAEWPPLAWAAECVPSSPVITIYHGSKVETRESWFCEAVWDGEFESGGFDLTDLVFGSGARIRNEQATFVSSGTTLDRLQAVSHEGRVWVSNSLACLLAITDAKLDPSSAEYLPHIGTIAKGFRRYERELAVSAGTVRFMYFNNLRWDGTTLTDLDKPDDKRDFSTFAKYSDFLLGSLGSIASNMAASGRQNPYQMLGTLSSGYDSTTTTVLAHKVGLREVISFSNAPGGLADDGKDIADLLGIRHSTISRSGWKSLDLVEVPFIASDAKGEDVYFRAAEELLHGRVLLTGFYGDKVWARGNLQPDPTVVRGDRAGLSLTEYRLWAGFIHLPLPFMGVRQLSDINAISDSPEMAPWDIPGDYSRPICRRIVEGAGVSRGMFGTSKKAASVLYGRRKDSFSPATRDALYQWLRSHSNLWASNGKTPPYKASRLLERFHWPYSVLKRGLYALGRISPLPLGLRLQGLSRRLESFEHSLNPLLYAFPWAIEEAKKNYRAFAKHRKQWKEA